MDARFCSNAAWKKLVAQPGNNLRSWIAGVAPATTNLVIDTWAWELQKGASGDNTVVKGLVRIKKANGVGHLLTTSGRVWEDKRCFWEALDWTTTPQEGWGKKPYVKWIEKERNENDLEYAARAASLGGTHGLARGWRQLGLRSMSPFEGEEKPSTRLWVLKNSPRHWDMSEIDPFLSSAGFVNIDFVSKIRDRLGTSWMFRAQRSDQETYLQLLYDGESFDQAGKFLVCELVARDRRGFQHTRLKNELRVPLRPATVVDLTEDKPDESEQIGDTHMEDDDENKGERGTEATKRPAVAGVGTSPEKKKVRPNPAMPDGVSRVPNPGAGNCLFEAIAQGIAKSGGGEHSHRAVRAAAVSHLTRQKTKYFPFVWTVLTRKWKTKA